MLKPENRWFYGFLLAVACWLFFAVSPFTNRDAVYWAVTGQWSGGIGSIAAAIAAVWVAVRGWQQSDRHIAAQARLAKQEAEEEKASRFAVWVIPNNEGYAEFKYLNGMNVPALDAVLTLEGDDGPVIFRLGTLGPEAEVKPLDAASHFATSQIEEELVTEMGGDDKTYVWSPDGNKTTSIFAMDKRRNHVLDLSYSVTFYRGETHWKLSSDGTLKTIENQRLTS